MSSNLDYSYEPIVIIPDTPLPELDDIQEKTDEEVSLGSEKKSKNLPPTCLPSHI
jgi:hypothetical protein